MGNGDLRPRRQQTVEVVDFSVPSILRFTETSCKAVTSDPRDFVEEWGTEDIPCLRIFVHALDCPTGFPCPAGCINYCNCFYSRFSFLKFNHRVICSNVFSQVPIFLPDYLLHSFVLDFFQSSVFKVHVARAGATAPRRRRRGRWISGKIKKPRVVLLLLISNLGPHLGSYPICRRSLSPRILLGFRPRTKLNN